MAGSLDDFVAVAEAEVGPEHPLLIPETLDAVFELLDLSGDFGIVAVRKHVPKLGAALGRALDLGLDLRKCLHVFQNDSAVLVIPERRNQEDEDDDSADSSGGDGKPRQ